MLNYQCYYLSFNNPERRENMIRIFNSSVSMDDDRIIKHGNNLTPFSADWIITKDTVNRAIIYPMLALEDGKSKYSHEGQQNFHDRCHNEHFDHNIFII